MALTYRSEKGSALTITELDNNFRYFTGSHSITGPLTVAGNIIPGESTNTLGTVDDPWKELYIDGGTIYFVSGSSSGSLGWSSGSGFDFGTGSATFDGGLTVTGSVTVSGSIIPSDVNGTLGTPNNPWKELYVDDGTVNFISSFNPANSGSLSWSDSKSFKLDSNLPYNTRLYISNSAGPQLILGDSYGSINIGSGSGGENIGNAPRFGNSVAIGTEALANLTVANGAVAVGNKAGFKDSATYSVYIGTNAGEGLTPINGNNVIVGGYAMSQSLATGIGNVAVGGQAGQFNKSSNNTYIGQQAGGIAENGFATSDNNVFIGYQAGWDRITGSNGGNMIVITGKNNSNGNSVGKGENTTVIGNEYITDTYLYGTLNLENVPTTDPGVPGAVWRDGTNLKISI
jgi:hypothetical protein